MIETADIPVTILTVSLNSEKTIARTIESVMNQTYKRIEYRVIKDSGNMIKHARRGLLWTTSHWCHPAAFSSRKTLLEYPYPLTNSHDDFDYATHVYLDGRKIIPFDKVISNFTFGGMSTQKSIKEMKRRIDEIYGIYKKYGMSKLYYLHRLIFETIKYFMI